MSRHVVVAGGGVGGLEAALALRALAPSTLEVTLLAPARHFVHRELAAGEARALRVPLAILREQYGIEHVRDAVDAVDGPAHELRTQDGRRVRYDAAVLALGARPVAAVPGALTYRGPHDLLRLDHVVRRVLDAMAVPRIVLAMPGGTLDARPLYDLALLVAAWCSRYGVAPELRIVTPELEPLRGLAPEDAAALAVALAVHGIAVQPATVPAFVEDGRLWTHSHGGVPADLVIALPHLSGPGVRGLASDDAGFALVDADCRAEGVPDVFAIGDMATRAAGPAGVAGQAQVVARRLAAWAGEAASAAPAGDGDQRLRPLVAAHAEVVDLVA